MRILKITALLAIVGSSSILSYIYGVNVGLTSMAELVGPALLQCAHYMAGKH